MNLRTNRSLLFGFALVCATFAAALLAQPACAQDRSEGDRLQSPPVRQGPVVELSSRLTTIAGRTSNFTGLRLNWAQSLGDRHVVFGGVAAHALTTRDFDDLNVPCFADACGLAYAEDDFFARPTVLRVGATVDAIYGGLDLRYAYRLSRQFEVGGGVVTGPGYVEMNSRYGDEHDTFLSVEPELSVAYRPLSAFALTASTSYRFAPGLSMATFSPSDFSSTSFTLGVQFGW